MVDAAFNGAGKAVGLELWRIEKLLPVKQATINGKFHVGDSYILLSTAKSNSGAFAWNIHFWLGAESSHDEQGIAAYKTVELDDYLGGGPVQHREVQGAESQLFLSYFKSKHGNIEYLPGGVDSGFRKVERDVYTTRLLHLKGKRTVRVNEVPIARASLNKGDVFILDAGLKIYLFNGPTNNNYERAKGVEVASNINNDERGARAEIILLHEDPKDEAFWAHFGGFIDPASLPEGEPDTIVDAHVTRKLFQISDASGKIEFVEIAAAKGNAHFTKTQLDSNDVFLLQSAQGKVYLWIGKGANLNEKKEATARAVQYLKEHNLPSSTAIERVSEGTETAAFKSEFSVWDTPMSFGLNKNSNIVGATEAQAVDVAAILARKKAEDQPVDDGSGKLTVWVVKDFKKELVDPANHGQFFGGDSYILLYSYSKGNSRTEEHIIYFWLGNDSSVEEKGAAALLTVELDDSMGGKPVQVRVTQGKEPAHFRQLFKGKMIVFRGGHVTGAGATEQADTTLFHIKGTSALNTVAVEVTAQAASLNSDDTFVVVTPAQVFAWQGRGANAEELAVANTTAGTLADTYKDTGGREVVALQEGSEPSAFWEALGGQAEYPSSGLGEAAPRDARLFSASTATGAFKVEEIDNFDQSDLNDEDVFLLDTYTQLFVWIGSQSTAQEKEQGLAFAHEYAATVDDGRDVDIPIIRVTAGDEPRMFSAHFLGWDTEYFAKQSFKDPYQARLQALAAAKKDVGPSAPAAQLKKTNSSYITPPPAPAATAAPAPAPAAAAPAAPAVEYAAPVPGSFSADDLKNGLPAGVDPTQKEEYLDNASFTALFNMDRAAFRAQPKWKRDAAKKAAGLF